MANILQMIFSNKFSWTDDKNYFIWIQISLKLGSKGSIDNKPALVQIMTWCRQTPSHYLNQWWSSHWWRYASLGIDELLKGCCHRCTGIPIVEIRWSLISPQMKLSYLHNRIFPCWQYDVQWNPSEKARNVPLKLWNLVHFHAPFFTNHVYFTSHDRSPLLKGHYFGGLYRGVPLFV